MEVRYLSCKRAFFSCFIKLNEGTVNLKGKLINSKERSMSDGVVRFLAFFKWILCVLNSLKGQ